MKKLVTMSLLGVACVVGLTGCATTGFEQANKAADSIQKTKNELYAGHNQVTVVLNALDQVMNSQPAYVSDAYKEFVKQAGRLEKQGYKTGKIADNMRRKGASYFGGWGEEVAMMRSSSAREESAKRLVSANKDYERIEASVSVVKSVYKPFLNDLYDIQRSLNHDLTKKGLTAVSAIVKKAKEDGVKLQKSIADSGKVLNDVSKGLRR